MKKGKVLVFALTADTSGITQYILNMVGCLEQEFQFDIVSFHNERLKHWTQEHRTEYFEMDVSLYKHPVQYAKRLGEIFSGGYQAVHFHASSVSDLRQYRIAKRCGIPKIIVHCHSTQLDLTNSRRRELFTQVHEHKRKGLVRLANVLCACSRSAAQWMYGPEAAHRAVILHNAIDVSRFSFNKAARNELRWQYRVEHRFVVGHVGRFAYSKNHEFLLLLFQKLRQKRPDAVLFLIGEGELRETIERMAERLGIQEDVFFLDFTQEVNRFYQMMDCFILPSRFEALPLTLIEAQAAGLPCFASRGAVSTEAQVTDLLQFLPLENGPELWADAIAQAGVVRRAGCAEQIEQAGYSLAVQAARLRKLYAKN